MIGLVVVTHGRLAEEFIAAAEHVVGRLEAARAFSIGPEDDMDMRRKEIIAAAKAAFRVLEEQDSGDALLLRLEGERRAVPSLLPYMEEPAELQRRREHRSRH